MNILLNAVSFRHGSSARRLGTVMISRRRGTSATVAGTGLQWSAMFVGTDLSSFSALLVVRKESG